MRPTYRAPVRLVNRSDVVQTRKALPKIILRERLYIPKALLTPEVKKAFSVLIENYYPEVDENGEYIENRDLLVKGWRDHQNGWISLSRGHLDKIWELFEGKAEIVDRRSYRYMQSNLQWTDVLVDDGSRKPLKPEQVVFINDLMDAGYGIGEAPPRFGKTICMVNMSVRSGMRTLVIVHQIELAKQFVKALRRCTNIASEERRLRKQLAPATNVGVCKTMEDFENFDVCVTTWQRFHAPMPKNDAEERMQAIQLRKRDSVNRAFKRLRDAYGIVLVDETHRAAAECFSRVVDQFNPWYRFGVTATPDRKDQLDSVIKLIVGPVITEADEQKVPLRVRPVYTGFAPKFTRWHAYESQIMRDGPRNKLALKLIDEDVKKGHSTLVVCNRTKHILDLVQALKARGISAEAFWSGQRDRDGVLDRATRGLTKVTVAMRSMLLGINVPRWSAMHILTPSNNEHNHRQEISRVRTIMEGKEFAVVRDYLDACGASNGCYATRHKVYLSAKCQPVSFEDEHGNPTKKISLAYIKSRSQELRKIKGKVETLAEMGSQFGAGGPKAPRFSSWEGFGQQFN